VTAETIPALLARQAREIGAREALVDDAGRVDYADLDRLSAARAALFVAMGVNKGRRVGLLGPNGIDWALNAYALMRIGAVLVPLSTFLRPPELQAQLAIAGVRHLIAVSSLRGRDYRGEISGLDRGTLPSLRNVWWAEELSGAGDADLAAALEARVRPADDLAIIFTSGSRGAPKGVIHTHAAAIRATEAGLADRCVRPNVRVYAPMPFFWIGGFGQGPLSTLIAGATLLVEAEPEPSAT
jgi:acyl-CoA synthetase (AMP-forming)/AMP-acid ligase II